MSPRIVEIRQNILKQNDLLARELRRRYAEAGVYVVNLVSGPGSGKTALLEATLSALKRDHAVAALTGDLATDNDARRLARSGAPVRQICTGTVCHLDAKMIEESLAEWELDALRFLFIENVGNLVCPASYDLGESLRVVLLSVTEGEDKPLKYPTLFHSADVAVITKCDLADAVGFDRSVAYDNLGRVSPTIRVFETSARTGEGVAQWLQYLESCAQLVGRPLSSAPAEQ
ncbi:MAG TPA: hydrogenase nickel incorporation protein HypB [Gemmatimonadaceae bacterium]|jgi:hydrogenase nickel incorporation protein HypB